MKLEWADQHICDLETAVSVFINTHPCELSFERDLQSGDIAIVIGRCKLIPDNLCLLTADILNALRSALDYLARQLVIANHQLPSRKCGFPIFIDFELFKSMSGRMIQDMSLSAQTNIKALQPFNPGLGENRLLWALHELNNADKHHFPLAMSGRVRPSGFAAKMAEVGSKVLIRAYAEDAVIEIKEGAKLDLGISTDHGVHVDAEVTVSITLPKIGNSADRELISTLRGMCGMTKGIISLFLDEFK